MIYPFVTYPAYVVVLFSSLFRYRLKLSRRNFVLILILISFIMGKFLGFLLSSNVFRLSDLAEFKIIFFIIMLLLISRKIPQRAASTLYTSYVLFGLACMVYVFISTGKIIRFMDLMPGFTHYLSIYFTVTAACFLAVFKSKIIPYFFVLGSASGTGLLAIIPVFLSNLLKSVKNPVFFVVMLSAGIIGISFILSVQASRGRMLLDLTTIDRFLFYSAIYEYVPTMSWKDILFGHNFGEHIAIDKYVPMHFAEYLLVERDGYIPPRMFHSDYIRIFLQFGLFGLLFMLYCLWISVSNRLLLIVLFMAAFANSIFYISSIMITVFYLNRIEADERV